MKPASLMLRLLGERHGSQWTVMCLDFTLAAQGNSLEEARALVEAQIRTYLNEAITGADKEHAFELIARRAPLSYWLKFYFFRTLAGLGSLWPGVKAFRDPLPVRFA